MAPTTSPRLLVSGRSASSGISSARPAAAYAARLAPSSTLRARAVPSARPTQRTPSAPRFATAPGSAAHDERVDGLRAADEVRPRRHRPDDRGRLRPLPGDETGERPCHLDEREGERRDAAAVDGRLERLRGTTDRRGDDPAHLELDGMPGEPVALGLPASLAREEKEAGVLPRAVVPEARAVLGPALEIVLRGPGPREKRANGVELLGSRLVGGTRDGELLVRQAERGERERLERLRGRADVGDGLGVAPAPLDPPVAEDHRVHAVPRLDEPATLHGYADRVHEEELFPSFPRWRRLAGLSTSASGARPSRRRALLTSPR